MKHIVMIILAMYFITGCNSSNVPHKSISLIKQHIIKAAAGDTSGNNLLSGLLDSNLPRNTHFTKLVIDSLKINNIKKIYCVLIQYENPLYNRLAIYNTNMDLLLLDRSLNGNVSLSFTKLNGQYLRVVEGFISQDLINLKRLSFYKLDTSAAYLSFRSFLSMSRPDMFLSQEVEQITDELIITNISFPERMFESARKDTFVFYPLENRYKSKKRTFDSLVIKQVNSYTSKTFLPELTRAGKIKNNN